MDFRKLGSPKGTDRPTHPIRIFERLPNLPGTPNDLWRGQAAALENWHEARNASDVLVSLNTGAGKTLVGLLIAQGLVNERVENVVYVCATIDLVLQTSSEAESIGLEHTIRVRSEFSNDLFESGRAFCITTYHALFNGLSAIRRRHFPGAVIFDDAHVAESILRSSLTLSISASAHPELFGEVTELFRPHFRDLRIEGRFNDSLTAERPMTVMAAPGGLAERRDRLIALLEKHGISGDGDLKYPYAYLRDKLDCCALLFSQGKFELAPPFLPSLALDIFERPVRRVYLSATLKSKTDLVRAFGRIPDVWIEPDNDAGNGERLVLFGRGIEGGISPDLVSVLSDQHKVLVAVPSYQSAKLWEDIAEPPDTRNFSAELDRFRSAEEGVFVLVSRVDGIDLPHDTCRIMVLDGLPSGSSLLERYQWEYLRMLNLHATRIANRLVQLFGRINRGRNDYGAFLIAGSDLNTWVFNDRNLALLPALLQSQVLLGRAVQDGMTITDSESVRQVVDAVLSRESSWLDYYGDNIQHGELDPGQVDRADSAEDQMVEAANAEAAFAAFMWNGDVVPAINALDESVQSIGRVDALLSGWQSVWVGGAFEMHGDLDSAHLCYKNAMDRLGNMLTLPRRLPGADNTQQPVEADSPFASKVISIAELTINERFDLEMERLRIRLAELDGGTPSQMEEATRMLGEVLGLTSSRPDNDVGTGPDVLWIDDHSLTAIAFELKTDKDDPATYWKKDISQGHDHLEWIAKSHPDVACLGLIYIGPEGSVEVRANPSDEMWFCVPANLAGVRDRLFALVNDVRRCIPLERAPRARELCNDGSWALDTIFEEIEPVRINTLEQSKR